MSRRTLLIWACPAAAAVVFVGVWWVFGAAVNPVLFSSPVRTVQALWEMVLSGELRREAATTAATFALGAGAGTAIGVLLGMVAALAPALRQILNPIATAIWATPVVAMVPLVIIFFGIDNTGRVALVLIAAIVPIYMSTVAGLLETPKHLIEMASSFGASQRAFMKHVAMPSALPHIMAGLRVGLGRALAGVIVAEIFLDSTGLGGLIQTSSAYLRIDRMLAGAFVLASGGMTMYLALDAMEKRLVPWRGTSSATKVAVDG